MCEESKRLELLQAMKPDYSLAMRYFTTQSTLLVLSFPLSSVVIFMKEKPSDKKLRSLSGNRTPINSLEENCTIRCTNKPSYGSLKMHYQLIQFYFLANAVSFSICFSLAFLIANTFSLVLITLFY